MTARSGPHPAAYTRVVLLAVLLTVGTGTTDAITFTRLDEVFSSVMTGNLVLLGVAAVRGDGAAAAGLGTAIGGFVLGALAGGRVATPAGRDEPLWPPRVTVALGGELVVLGVFLAAWEVVGGRPEGAVRLGLLAAAALSMGLQSAAVRGIGISGLSTTYLTGTLVGLLGELAGRRRTETVSGAILLALVGGAAVGVLLLMVAPATAPLVPMVTVGTAITVAVASQRAADR